MNKQQEAEYNADAERLRVAIQEWIAIECEKRCPLLLFKAWGGTCYIGPLCGAALDWLADSPDARAMLEWADKRSGHKGTLLMARAVLEQLGLKPTEPPATRKSFALVSPKRSN